VRREPTGWARPAEARLRGGISVFHSGVPGQIDCPAVQFPPNALNNHVDRITRTMKKLSLALDELRVDSFATGQGEPRSGTVRANSGSLGCTEYFSCLPDTCGASCYNTCDPSHHRTCGSVTTCAGDSINLCQSDYC
jgi:hypothetical protein